MANLEEIQTLLDSSQTLQKNPEMKANIEANLPNLTETEIGELAKILENEKEKLAEISQRYETEIQELNEKMLIKSQELYARTKRVIREDAESVQSQNDNQEAEAILNTI